MANKARLLRQKLQKKQKEKMEEEKRIEEEKKAKELPKFQFKKVEISSDEDGDSEEDDDYTLIKKKEELKKEEVKKVEEPPEDIDPLNFLEKEQIEIKPVNPIEAFGIKIESPQSTIKENNKDDKQKNNSFKESLKDNKTQEKMPTPSSNSEISEVKKPPGMGIGGMGISIMDIMGAKLSLKQKEEKKEQKKEENDNDGNNADLPEMTEEKKIDFFRRLKENKKKMTGLRIKQGINNEMSESISIKVKEIQSIPGFNDYEKIQVILDKYALPEYIFEEDDDVEKIKDNDEGLDIEPRKNIDLAFMMKQTAKIVT